VSRSELTISERDVCRLVTITGIVIDEAAARVGLAEAP